MAAPGDDCGEKKENIGQAKKEMAEFYWNAVDEEIEHLLQLFGDIPDAERSEAIKVIFRLVTYARGTAEFGALVPPGTAMLEKLNTEPARLAKDRKIEQRCERLRPYVADDAAKHPGESPGRIAGRLLRRKGFRKAFGIKGRRSRRLEDDIASLLSPC